MILECDWFGQESCVRKILKVTKSFDKGRPNISVLYSTYKYFTIYKYKYYTYKYKSSTYKYKYSTYQYGQSDEKL